MDNLNNFSTSDFANALNSHSIAFADLHHPAFHSEPSDTEGPEKNEPIPDESLPLMTLYTDIIDKGLSDKFPNLKPNVLSENPVVIIIGAGAAGLCCGYELQRAGFKVVLLEASGRAGGRVKTFREPFAPGLHSEGGAMRLPGDHFLVHGYLKHFGMSDQLEDFDQANRVIHLSGLGKTISYNEFENRLKKQDQELLQLFPKLNDNEKGKTIDDLWTEATAPVNDLFFKYYNIKKDIKEGYEAVTEKYDKYSLLTFFKEEAKWSDDAIRLYDLGSAHVVFTNGFIESWKDGFLSSQSQGSGMGMKTMMYGMDSIPSAFLNPKDPYGLKDNIRFGARVFSVLQSGSSFSDKKHDRVIVRYRNEVGDVYNEKGDFVVFAVPFPALRLINITPPFDGSKATAISQCKYVEVTKVLLQFKTRWWEELLPTYETESSQQNKDGGGGMVTDLPVRYLMFPSSNAEMFKNDQKRGVVMASYTFEEDATQLGALPSSERLRVAVDNMSTVFGKNIVKDNFEVGISQVWSADQYSGGSAFAYFGPNQKSQLFGDIIRPTWEDQKDKENYAAHFAGEHASYTHGWIQGAYEAGLRVAFQIAQTIAKSG